MIKAKVSIPTSWNDLIKAETTDALSEKHRTGIADSTVYYDDNRSIEGRFKNGDTYILSLSSGQANYYGTLSIFNRQGRMVADEVLESFSSPIILETDEEKYKLVIKSE